MNKDILFSVLLEVKDIRILSRFKELNKKTKSIIESKWFAKCWADKWKHNHFTILLELLPKKNWNYTSLSDNSNLTWEYVSANPDKPWNYYWLSLNPNITWDIVQANPDKKWNYSALSSNPNITWAHVCARNPLGVAPDKDWDYMYLSRNPNITWDIMKDNSDKPWHYLYHIYLNKNITWKNVITNLDKNWMNNKMLKILNTNDKKIEFKI